MSSVDRQLNAINHLKEEERRKDDVPAFVLIRSLAGDYIHQLRF